MSGVDRPTERRAVLTTNQRSTSMKQGKGSSIKRLAALGAISLTIPFLAGCSGFFKAVTSTTGSGTSTFAYVTNGAGTLTEYSLTSGVLAQLSGSPITTPVAPTSIVVAPNNVFLYVGTGTGVFLYTIASDGVLTEGNSNTVAYINASNGALVAQSMVIDSTSSWLLISYQNSIILDAVRL